MNIRISICPTSLEYANGDRYDEGALLAALREYIKAGYPAATITCLQVGHRQGDEWATIDGDSEAGEALVAEFFAAHADDEELFVPEPPPVTVEVATCDETIRSLSGLEDVAGLEHHAMHAACEAYHRAATDALIDAGGRLNWCVPHGQRLLHSGWAGAKFSFSRGALGTMATDLTEAERQQIAAADEAGREAARKVIEAADAADAAMSE